MITGNSKIENMHDLKCFLASEILELEFAYYDIQTGDEIEDKYFIEIAAKKEAYEQLLKRLIGKSKMTFTEWIKEKTGKTWGELKTQLPLEDRNEKYTAYIKYCKENIFPPHFDFEF